MLASAITIGLMPVMTNTALAETHSHDGKTFTAWTSDGLPDQPGSYYLTKDVTLSGQWAAPAGETCICLNGKKITKQENKASVIAVDGTGTKLSVYDCKGIGCISHDSNTSGPGVGVHNGGEKHQKKMIDKERRS